MRFFERLDLGIGVPILPIHLVAADMEKLVGEELPHLLDELVDELVDLFPRGIGHRLIPVFVFDDKRARIAGQFGITYEPRTAVAGSIKLRNDADTPIMCVSEQVAYLFLRIKLPF